MQEPETYPRAVDARLRGLARPLVCHRHAQTAIDLLRADLEQPAGRSGGNRVTNGILHEYLDGERRHQAFQRCRRGLDAHS